MWCVFWFGEVDGDKSVVDSVIVCVFLFTFGYGIVVVCDIGVIDAIR
jgi:hypothetical protein